MPFSEKPSQVADAIDHAQALNYKPGMTAVTIPFARITPPKKLLVINGSPRVERSISAFLMNKFADGFQSVQGTSVEMIHLAKTKDKITLVQKYKQADCVMLAFPLYVDAMPGIVKEFIELLSPLAGREGNPPIGFLVQSGFPEAVHSRSVEKYLAQLTVRLNSPYLGTILRGGCGSVTIAPEIFNRRIFITLNELGEQLAQQGGFDPQTIRKFASLERFSKADVAVRKITSKTPLMQFYWQGLLRQNKAFDQRFNRPYLESDNVVEKIV
jgi:NAD(P)H-dependent FMN reductase